MRKIKPVVPYICNVFLTHFPSRFAVRPSSDHRAYPVRWSKYGVSCKWNRFPLSLWTVINWGFPMKMQPSRSAAAVTGIIVERLRMWKLILPGKCMWIATSEADQRLIWWVANKSSAIRNIGQLAGPLLSLFLLEVFYKLEILLFKFYGILERFSKNLNIHSDFNLTGWSCPPIYLRTVCLLYFPETCKIIIHWSSSLNKIGIIVISWRSLQIKKFVNVFMAA